jgi:hypothetical protein
MPQRTVEELEKELGTLLGSDCPACAAQDINAALQVSGLLEAKGFSFAMKDCCPKSMTDTRWRAVFARGDEEYAAEHESSAKAVCAAAVAALQV